MGDNGLKNISMMFIYYETGRDYSYALQEVWQFAFLFNSEITEFTLGTPKEKCFTLCNYEMFVFNKQNYYSILWYEFGIYE